VTRTLREEQAEAYAAESVLCGLSDVRWAGYVARVWETRNA
jgi:hypothetical protein